MLDIDSTDERSSIPSATTERVKDKEALESVASIGEASEAVDNLVNELFANSLTAKNEKVMNGDQMLEQAFASHVVTSSVV